jgi:hypothetical protein
MAISSRECITGPFTDPVHGHLHLPGPVDQAAHGIGRGHAQIIVAMGGNHRLVNILKRDPPGT